MKQHMMITIAIAILLLVAPLISGASIEKPSCEKIKAWTESHEAKQNFEPHPGVLLNTLFKDDKLIPVFNKPVVEWDREDFRLLQGWLSACRKQAYAEKDRAAGEQIYAAIKSTKLASRAMKPVWSEQKKKRQQLAAQNASKRQVKIADENQRMSEREKAHQKSKSVSKNPKAQFTPEQHEALLNQIEAVPDTRAGIAQLSRIDYHTNPKLWLMSREQRDSYNRAFQDKRRAINAKLADEEAKAKAEALKPMDLASRLAWLFKGDEVDELTIGGIRPGIRKKLAIAKLRNDWDLQSDGMSIDSSSFAGKRQNIKKYKKERRSGGTVKLSSMDNDELGQLTFEEYYLAMSIPSQAQRWLSDKFGKPDKTQPGGGGVFMMWKDGNHRLQVFITNQTDVFWKGAGYKSRLALSYWSEDYEDFLKKVNKRCDEIKSKARNKWSMNDSTFFATQCNIGTKGRKPGL